MTPPRTADQQKDHDMLIEVLSGIRRIDETIERMEKQLERINECREEDEARIRALEQVSSARTEQIKQLQREHDERFAAIQQATTAQDRWDKAITAIAVAICTALGITVK